MDCLQKIFFKKLHVICKRPCIRNGLKDRGLETICGTKVLRKGCDR